MLPPHKWHLWFLRIDHTLWEHSRCYSRLGLFSLIVIPQGKKPEEIHINSGTMQITLELMILLLHECPMLFLLFTKWQRNLILKNYIVYKNHLILELPPTKPRAVQWDICETSTLCQTLS
jgi:hypothetical protein